MQKRRPTTKCDHNAKPMTVTSSSLDYPFAFPAVAFRFSLTSPGSNSAVLVPYLVLTHHTPLSRLPPRRFYTSFESTTVCSHSFLCNNPIYCDRAAIHGNSSPCHQFSGYISVFSVPRCSRAFYVCPRCILMYSFALRTNRLTDFSGNANIHVAGNVHRPLSIMSSIRQT